MDWEQTEWDSREDYIRDIAEEWGVDYQTALMLADLLGDEELFDGFVTGLEDAEMMDYKLVRGYIII